MNEQIKDAMKKSGFSITPDGLWEANYTSVEHFAKLVEAVAVAREREACAKLCEEMLTEPMLVGWNGFKHYMAQCAQRIRGRTE